MTAVPPVVRIAVDDATGDLTDSDRVLRRAFEALGAAVVPHKWYDPVPRGSCVVVRSTWDYVEHESRFRAWLDHLDAVEAIVHNGTDLLRWNIHKGYLVELEQRGVPIVPTSVLHRGASTSLREVLAANGWGDVVIKPAVGASARETVRSGSAAPVEADSHLRRLLATHDVIVQPFVGAVTTSGEISVMVVAGEPLHAVVKRPRQGGWLVQSEHGGVTERLDLDDALAGAAHTVLGALDRSPSYARVDLLHDGDRYLLIELELVEPELFFQHAPATADRLAEHVLSLMP